MKRKKVIGILLIMLSIMVACEKKQDESEIKELIFLEKTKDYIEHSFIFESSKDEKYYLVEVSNWQYDNTTYQKGDVVKLESIESAKLGVIERLLFHSIVPKSITLPDEDVYIFDDRTSLFILNDYTKTD